MLTSSQRALAALEASAVPLIPWPKGDLEARIGMAYAHRGDRAAAIEWGTRALGTNPSARDAYAGPGLLVPLASIYIILGEREAAIETLDQALSLPNVMSVNGLKLDPWYDSLRDHPQFQALLEKYGN